MPDGSHTRHPGPTGDAPAGGGQTNLRALAARGGAATGLAEIVRVGLTTVAIIVLARLLTPADFGLIAMIAPIVALVTLADLGLPAAAVQRTELSHQQISALFWVNATSGAVFMALAWASAPAVASFYGEPRLASVTRATAAMFFFSGIAVQHEALLRRRMRFTAVAVIDTASVVVGLSTAIFLALWGAGHWALVVQPIATAAFKCIVLWALSGWRPEIAFRFSPAREMLAFGSQLTAFRLIQFTGRALDKVLIGYYSGATQLGFYANASALVVRPVNRFRVPFSNVAHATLSRVQTDPARYRSLYRAGVMVTTAVTLPILGFLLVDGETVIVALLGPTWRGALPIFRILILGAFARALAASVRWVYLSLGATGRQLRWGVIESGTLALGFAIGISWGPTGVAAAYSATSWILFLPSIFFCFKGSPLQARDLFGAAWRSIVACTVAALGLYLIHAYGAIRTPSILRLMVDLALFSVIYALAWLATPNGSKMAARALHLAR